MDPASVVGLVAACSSLVKTCGTVAKSLHDATQTYRDAELSILSMIEQCENIRLAWTSLEAWAGKHLNQMDNSAELLDRFQRSIYSGQLTMAQLEKDLSKSRLQRGIFLRRINMVWNATIFNEHQSRLRDQSASLQLLLQVVSLPRNEDRMEVMSINEPVFRKADDSVLSIIPSRLSSRFSSRLLVEDDAASSMSKASLKSRLTVELRYIPFSFDNDLFTSHVYKRNYRVPSMTLSQSSIKAKSMPTHTSKEQPMETIEERLESDQPKQSRLPSWFVPLIVLAVEPVTIDFTGIRRPRTVEVLEYLAAEQFGQVLELVRDGFDLFICFQQEIQADVDKLVPFFWYLLRNDIRYFCLNLERIAYSVGETWTEAFKTIFLERRPRDDHGPDPEWPVIDSAAKFYDQTSLLAASPLSIPSPLRLACAAGNMSVAAHLLELGFRPDSKLYYQHPVLPAKAKNDEPMVSLLLDHLGVANSDEFFNNALISLFASHEDFFIWFDAAGPRKLYLDDAIVLFIQNGASPKHHVCFGDKQVSLLCGIIYTLHLNHHRTERHWAAFRDYMKYCNDQDRNQLTRVIWDYGGWISPLGLAAMLGEGSIMKILLRFGAALFWCEMDSSDSIFNMATAEAAVDFISAWCLPPLNSEDKIRLEKSGLAISPGLSGTTLDLTSSIPSRIWKKARLRLAKCETLIDQAHRIHSKKVCIESLSDYSTAQTSNALRNMGHIHGRNYQLTSILEEDIAWMGGMTRHSFLKPEIASHIRARNFEQAFDCFVNTVDLAILFHRESKISLQDLVKFLEFVGDVHHEHLNTFLKRIAYATGSAGVKFLRSSMSFQRGLGLGTTYAGEYASGQPSSGLLADSVWREPFIAGLFADITRQSSTRLVSATSMEMAALANDYQVLQYLLERSYHGASIVNSLVAATLNHSVPTVKLILSCDHPDAAPATALNALISSLSSNNSEDPPIKLLDSSWAPCARSVLEIINILQTHGEEPLASINAMRRSASIESLQLSSLLETTRRDR